MALVVDLVPAIEVVVWEGIKWNRSLQQTPRQALSDLSTRQRKHLSRVEVGRIVRAAAEGAASTRRYLPTGTRHALASHALDRGAPIHLVQGTLGHANTLSPRVNISTLSPPKAPGNLPI